MKRMISGYLVFTLIFGLLVIAGCGQQESETAETTETGQTVVYHQDGVDIASSGVEMSKLAEGFSFTEGPAPDIEGNVYFSDIPNNRILVWTLEDELEVFLENSGGANGLYIDDDGYIIACQGNNRQLVSISPSGEVSVLADEYEGNQFNSPNDLWIAPNGGIYFTDPRYGDRDNMEMAEHVYYLSPDRNTLSRVIDDMTRPNGVIGTPDGTTLYVADAGAGETYRYSINADGTLSNKSLFVSQGSDGLTLDSQGNVYITREAIEVYTDEGEHIATINVPESPANLCFGGGSMDELYITARTSFYMIPMQVRGVQIRE